MDEGGDMLADSNSILSGWKNGFCQLTNVHWVNAVKYTEIHKGQSLVSEPSDSEVEMAIEKLQGYKLPSIVEIPVELI
jgi:hypothetical protein